MTIRQGPAHSAGGMSRTPRVALIGWLAGTLGFYERARIRPVLAADPFALFDQWFRAAQAAGARQPEAMALATADARGRPSVRYVLLKGWGPRGFEFYTNFDSQKGRQLAANPRAAMTVYWRELGRQVRAEGRVSKLSRAAALRYWASRPRESQAAALSSAQSRPVASREELEAAYRAVLDGFDGVPIPLPDFWGGYRLRPEAIEFWQHRDNRLHDRLRYARRRGGWRTAILQP